MTLEQMVAELDRHYARAADATELLLADHGATPDEIAAALARLAMDRDQQVEKLTGWVQRGGEPLH